MDLPREPFAERRARMVDQQLRSRGITDPRVLDAMRRVERHRFVSASDVELAYGDHPVDIGFGQTISQPYIVGFMTQALAITPNARILEIGTGSGYQTAVLAEIAQAVYSIEVVPEHGHRARELLRELGYTNVSFRIGDGHNGWPDGAPFDGVLVAAAADRVPPPLIEQLRLGGRLVAPVGRGDQELLVLVRTTDGVREVEERMPVRFVPFVRTAL